ncbi:hypothetical protein MAPG_03410 [Magnaporthiopsis poae ATCC 64411]|uniref:Uncharacterized protein n=1 Tax=Magnaporthiopsis poae (strain ATCC 64411 / 73-15) TaxID=644358 RepID=A0A0C4DTY1_MAGP6|nr:hypothetical protein MAPG_03410 [Magnaporthiopsis poae ATCC 64411]
MFPRSAADRWLQSLVLGAVLAATAGAQTNAGLMARTTIASPHSNETIVLGTDYMVQWAAPAGASANVALWLLGRPNLDNSTNVGIRELADFVQLSSQAWVWRPEQQTSDSELSSFPRGEFQARRAIIPAYNGTAPPPANNAPAKPLAPEVVAGITIGAAAVVLLLAGVLFCYFIHQWRKGSQTRDSGVGDGKADEESAGGLSKPERGGSGGYGCTANAVACALNLKPELMEREIPEELDGKENDSERPNPNERYEVAVHETYEMDGSRLPELPEMPEKVDAVVGTQQVGLVTTDDKEPYKEDDVVTPAVSPTLGCV